MPLAGYCSPISFPEEQIPSPSRAQAAGKPSRPRAFHLSFPEPCFLPVPTRTGTAAPRSFCLRVPRDVELFNDDERLPSKGQLLAWTSPIADPSELSTWAQTLLCSMLLTHFPSREEQTRSCHLLPLEK